MTKLTRMTDAEYAIWQPRSVANYIDEKKKANSLTQAEAVKIAHDDFKRLLPEGLATKDNYLYSVKDGDRRVGFIWFCVRGPADNRRAFIADIVIEPEERGRGHGRQAMTLIEDEVKKLGLKRIGLHVFGFNKTAIGLYQSLGYDTTDLSMEKHL